MERLEEIVEELRKVYRFKTATQPGDIVLVATEKPQTLFYGYVRGLERDVSKRDEWWHLTFFALGVPPQRMTWTLRVPQFTGVEIFTMGGEKHFMQAVDFGEPEQGPTPKDGRQKRLKPALRVLK